MNSEKLHYLTPVQQVDGMLFKREDLYTPLGAGEVNGGKLRQCMLLVNKIHREYEGLVTCCSIHSPQAPITAATGKGFRAGMPNPLRRHKARNPQAVADAETGYEVRRKDHHCGEEWP